LILNIIIFYVSKDFEIGLISNYLDT